MNDGQSHIIISTDRHESMLLHNKLESDTCVFSFILNFDISHVYMKPADCDMQSIKL